jgi:hypothetical protein
VPSLGTSARGKVDGEPAGGGLEAGVADRGADTLTRFLDGPVGQADDGEVGQSHGAIDRLCPAAALVVAPSARDSIPDPNSEAPAVVS